MIPLEVLGISMAPWIQPGDVVGLEPSILIHQLELGDLAVFRHEKTKAALVHRVISLNPLLIKGDRNPEVDQLGPEWKYEGKVTQMYRDGKWRGIKHPFFFHILSKFGFYPGQKFPQWMSRTAIKNRMFK